MDNTLFLLQEPGGQGTKIHLNSQSDLKLTGAEILQPVGIVKADLPGLVDDLAQLDADIKEEAARAIAKDKEHDNAIAQEVTDRLAGDDALSAKIDKEIAGEAEARAAEDKVLDAAIKQEEADRIAADDVLTSDLATEKARIDAILSGATFDKDSFAEIVTFINDVDMVNDDALMKAIMDINTSIDAVQADVDKNEADADAAIAAEAKSRDEAIAAEQKARASAIEAVQADVDKNEADADAAIAAEEAARIKGDTAEAEARAAADDAIIASVGYINRGDLASKLFAEYAAFAEAEFEKFASTEFYPVNEANFAAWLSRQDEDARKALDSTLTTVIKETADESNKADAEIIAAVGYNDRGEASDVAYNEYVALTEEEIALNGGSPYAPINEANFQAWLDNQRKLDLDQLSNDVQADVDTKVAELTKADEAIIAAVGYNNRGAASDVLYNTYAAETEAAIEAGGSEYAPINEVNFQAWLDNQAKVARETADSQLSADLKEAIAISDKGDAALQADIDAEIKRATGVEADLDKAIKSEANDRIAADTTLQGNIDAEKARVDAILSGATFDKDSFAEIVEFINAVDMTNDDALMTAIMDMNAADTANADALAAHVAQQSVKDGEQDAALSTEATDRAAADTTLQANIDAEAKDRAAADNQIITDYKDAVAAEAKDRAAADDQLTANLAAEAKDRDAADTAIIEAVGYNQKGDATAAKFNDYSAAITAELDANGDSPYAPINEVNFQAWLDDQATSDNTAALQAEEAARIKADEALQAAIDAEIKRAEAAEGELDGKIKEIISNTDLQSLDSFSEVEKGVNSGFESLKQMILEVSRNSVELNFGTTEADGTAVEFGPYLTREPKVFVNGLLQEQDFDYTVSQDVDGKGNTVSTVTFGTAPVAGARVMAKGVGSDHDADGRYEAPVVFTPGS